MKYEYNPDTGEILRYGKPVGSKDSSGYLVVGWMASAGERTVWPITYRACRYLDKWTTLTVSKMITGGSTYVRPLTPRTSTTARVALRLET